MGGGDFLRGVKQPWPENDFSLPTSTAEIKNVWNYDFTPYDFMAPCLVKHRNNLALSIWWLTSVAFDTSSYKAYPFLVQLSNNGITSPGFVKNPVGTEIV
jgi:hypothetical protein